MGDARTPKPLKPVAGTPMLLRVLRTLAAEGIREAVVVTGYEADRVAGTVADFPAVSLGGLSVTLVHNPRWMASNGLSVLAAADFIDRDCMLVMGDHMVAPELVRRVLRAELPPGACALGVDFDVERCFDLDDATKVKVTGTLIEAIGKDLADCNAVDTGVFRVDGNMVAALRGVAESRGDASLTDGVRVLASQGAMLAVDVGDARWIDVDTPEAHARAEALVRVFGDSLGDTADQAPGGEISAEAMEFYAPSWGRGAQPYREDHLQLADREARSRHGEFARLMSNESPFRPSPAVIAAVVEVMSRGNRYPDASLAKELRTRLAQSEGLGEECCVLGAGSSEVIDFIVRAFVAPGEEAVVAVPTFSMYEARVRVSGGLPVIVPMLDDLVLDVPGILAAVTERTKLVFLCSPNNPTGKRVDDVDLRRILRLGIPTVVDEAYLEFADDPRSVASLVAEQPNLVVIRTFSKALGLAGLRVGYALASEPVARMLCRVKLPWNVSSVALVAALAVLTEADAHRQHRTVVCTERSYLRDALSRIPGIEVHDSDGNFLLLDVHETHHSADALVQTLLHDGVCIRSLASHHLRRGYVRVSVGSPEENRRCVDAFQRAVLRRPRAQSGAVQ